MAKFLVILVCSPILGVLAVHILRELWLLISTGDGSNGVWTLLTYTIVGLVVIGIWELIPDTPSRDSL